MNIARRIGACLVPLLLCFDSNAARALDMEQLKQNDSALIAQADGRARRDGGVLTLRLRDGKVRRYVDETACPGPDNTLDQCSSHHFAGFDAKRHTFLVLNLYWEWGDFYLVDEITGTTVTLADEPHYSPDGNWFAVVADRDCCGPRTVEIWRATESRPILAWTQVPKEHFAFDAWQDNRQLRLTITRRHGNAWVDTTASVSLKNGQWRLSMPADG